MKPAGVPEVLAIVVSPALALAGLLLILAVWLASAWENRREG